jgi:hypothetical protein
MRNEIRFDKEHVSIPFSKERKTKVGPATSEWRYWQDCALGHPSSLVKNRNIGRVSSKQPGASDRAFPGPDKLVITPIEEKS